MINIHYYIAPETKNQNGIVFLTSADSAFTNILFGHINKSKFGETHKLVYEEPFDSKREKLEILEKLFERFNDPENPLGSPEKQEFIKSNRLHTSMSVGDVVIFKVEGAEDETWVCQNFGWNHI
ncbi:MAG TPA: hypothetical protein PKD85_00690 [Saprospiraceae bacterium]|nr:hypothetical protein [Saprospiraceae bacterium]